MTTQYFNVSIMLYLDKKNGNHYFSARAYEVRKDQYWFFEVDCGIVPMQYGDDAIAMQEVKKMLVDNWYLPSDWNEMSHAQRRDQATFNTTKEYTTSKICKEFWTL